MALNEFNEVDYYAEAVSRYTDQFQNKPVFDKYVQLLLNEKINAQQAMIQLMQLRSLDTATGVQLDNIGNIVGQERILVDTGIYKYFGWEEDITAGEWADETVEGSGFEWVDEYSLDSPIQYIALDDNTYRLFIRSKILKNISGISPEEVIEFFNFLFKTSKTKITELYPNTVVVSVGKQLTFQEKQFLYYVNTQQGYADRLFPKPAGVRFQFVEVSYPYFAFSDTQGASGFDVGKFASIT